MAKQIEATPIDLTTLRLPELQARFSEVVGEMSRSPNRKFLIRRIEETLAAQPAPVEETPVVADEPAAEAPAAQPEPAPAEPQLAVEAEGACPENGDDCVGCALCDPADVEVVGVIEPAPAEQGDALASTPVVKRGRFAAMSVEELHAKYIEVVGRSTGSDNKAYLIWKIREAEKGRITVGPVQTRKTEGEPADVKILPLRLETETVERMDAAWRERGIKTRMEFFRRALGHYLAHLGAADVAALFAAAE
jgi:hypothetical protein